MRPLTFAPDALRKLLLRDKIATLPDLKHALGTDVDLTVFRKLKQLDYLTSYSHGGRFYTLREIARFGADGLWSSEPAWFSRYGTLLATAEGGSLICCNNVAQVDRAAWLDQLERSARKAGRPIREVEWIAPEADFPSPVSNVARTVYEPGLRNVFVCIFLNSLLPGA